MQVLETINRFYSSDEIVKFYTEKSLFPEEKIIFNKYLSGRGTILDLCCGAGRASFPLAQMGHEVIGVDINQNLIKAARNKSRDMSNPTFILSDVEKVNFPENYFDHILILHNSLESIPSKEKRDSLFRKLNKSLKKDGLLISTFHSAYSPFHVVRKLIKSNVKNVMNPELEYNDFFYKKDGLFYHVFTPLEIFRSFTKNGFKVHAIHGCRELSEQKSSYRKTFNRLLLPFDYTYWIFKKK